VADVIPTPACTPHRLVAGVAAPCIGYSQFASAESSAPALGRRAGSVLNRVANEQDPHHPTGECQTIGGRAGTGKEGLPGERGISVGSIAPLMPLLSCSSLSGENSDARCNGTVSSVSRRECADAKPGESV